MMDVRYRAELEAVRALMRDQLGFEQVPFDPALVPEPLRELADLAAQFGIGDDGARPDAMNCMPDEFVREAHERVRPLGSAIQEWLEAAPWSNEQAAFGALLRALDDRLAPPPDLREPVEPLDMAGLLKAFDAVKRKRRP